MEEGLRGSLTLNLETVNLEALSRSQGDFEISSGVNFRDFLDPGATWEHGRHTDVSRRTSLVTVHQCEINTTGSLCRRDVQV